MEKLQEEHRKEVESISNRTLTWGNRKDFATETNSSAITDHVAKEDNHHHHLILTHQTKH